MGIAQSALILLGIGIVSSRFKAGVGLGELGTGISTLVAAPLTGTGTGLSSLAGGIRDISETLGDLGRGFSDLFASIPKLPSLPGASPAPPGFGPGEGWGANGGGGGARITFPTRPALLVPDSGGSGNTLLTGGGGAVTQPVIPVRPPPVLLEPGYTPRPPSVDLRPITIVDRLRPIMM